MWRHLRVSPQTQFKHMYCSIMWVLWSLEIEQELHKQLNHTHTHAHSESLSRHQCFKLFGWWLHCPVLICCLRSNFDGSFKNWCKMTLKDAHYREVTHFLCFPGTRRSAKLLLHISTSPDFTTAPSSSLIAQPPLSSESAVPPQQKHHCLIYKLRNILK